MKKTSSFLLVVAMLFTMLIPMLTVGVTAADLTGTGYEAFLDNTGAVASFVKNVEGTPTTYYVKTLAEAFAVGAEAGNGVDEVNMLENQTITLTSSIVVTAAKSFTINGNGSTITDDGSIAASSHAAALTIVGSSKDTVVTMNGFTVKLKTTSGNGRNVATLVVGEKGTDKPVTLVLKNTLIEENDRSYQTVIVNQGVKLVLDQGASVKNMMTKNLYSSNISYALLLRGTAEVEVKEGAAVHAEAAGVAAIDANKETGTENSKVVINGGTVTAPNGPNSILTKGTLHVNGGIITASNGNSAILTYGTLYINGGTITGKTAVDVNGGTATVDGGTFVATNLTCLVAQNGASVTVNDGTFQTSSDDLILYYGWGLVHSRGSGTTVTINDGHFRYPKAGVTGNDGRGAIVTSDADTLTLNGGTFCNAVSDNGTVRVMNGTNTIDFTNVSSKDGASVRTVKDESGIRFTSTIAADAITLTNAINKDGTDITYGTVIAPYEYVQQAGGIFTMKALDEADIQVGGVTVAADKRYVNVVAKDGITENEDGSVTFRAALIKLHENNLERDFAAIPYVSYVTDSGKTVIIYGNFDSTKNVRNMREIAYEALEDVETESTDLYGTPVTEWYELEGTAWVKKTGTAYSRYSTAQLDVIKSYLPKE